MRLLTTNKVWRFFLFFGLLFGVAYVIVDDNNVVPRGIENAFYYLAWLCVFAAIFFVLKGRTKSQAKHIDKNGSNLIK